MTQGTANLDRNRAAVFVAGTGPNGETTVAIPLSALVDLTGAPLPAGTEADPDYVRPLGQTSVSATIANGASLSGAIDCGAGYRPVRIVMPASWTAANLTLQTSYDGSTYNDAYDSTGTEITITAAASRSIVLSPATFLGVRRFKLRSGTASAAVNQGADRALTIVVQGL